MDKDLIGSSIVISVPKSLPPGLQAEAVQKAAREVGWSGREAEARTLRPSGSVGSRQGSKCGWMRPEEGMWGRGRCATERIHLAVSRRKQTSHPHPFPFLREDGLEAGGESASSKRSRAPDSLPARALHRLAATREVGDGRRRGPGA